MNPSDPNCPYYSPPSIPMNQDERNVYAVLFNIRLENLAVDMTRMMIVKYHPNATEEVKRLMQPTIDKILNAIVQLNYEHMDKWNQIEAEVLDLIAMLECMDLI